MDGEIRALIARWGAVWGVPDLEHEISVSFSSRLRKSLGRCRPSTGRVTLRADLRDGDPERLAEVLCHEIAHVAAFRLHGPAAAPHRAEWRELVSRAGFTPRVRAIETIPARALVLEPPAILPCEHRCPVCQSVRYARRPVPRWRCAECLEAGLSGDNNGAFPRADRFLLAMKKEPKNWLTRSVDNVRAWGVRYRKLRISCR